MIELNQWCLWFSQINVWLVVLILSSVCLLMVRAYQMLKTQVFVILTEGRVSNELSETICKFISLSTVYFLKVNDKRMKFFYCSCQEYCKHSPMHVNVFYFPTASTQGWQMRGTENFWSCLKYRTVTVWGTLILCNDRKDTLWLIVTVCCRNVALVTFDQAFV